MHVYGDGDGFGLEVIMLIMRVVLEVLVNVDVYVCVYEVYVMFAFDGWVLELVVIDDGCGFDLV